MLFDISWFWAKKTVCTVCFPCKRSWCRPQRFQDGWRSVLGCDNYQKLPKSTENYQKLTEN